MTYIPAELRRLVEERAGGCCEYCLVHQADLYLSHEADHIISEKHRGDTTLINLCLSCNECNRFKGSDIGSIDLETAAFTPLFNPRTMQWEDHFLLENAVIIPLTSIGRVTEFLLRLNSARRVERRGNLIMVGRYPCP